ncbi:hypothetical protein Z043_123298 [Scleropages formosus]|uniref:Tubulin polyglutamylase TTLL2 n=1 Tax=Scleropages formosus TaxID=113540 RepID=A0A0P7XZX5_SCLFO|nr:hypothetical protein Z043_123298 [Scleropages formosus]
MGTLPLVFRLHGSTPDLVREVLLERGWEEYDEHAHEKGDWNLYWRVSTFRCSDFNCIQPWQRLNHHPKTAGLTRKDWLERNLRRMKGIFGGVLYGFSPTAFLLPNNYTNFLAEFTKQRRDSPSGLWICKPVDLSRGRGIFIFEDIKDLTYDSPVVVQRYISDPLLISGYKFDLRLYVCVKSFHPLTVYIHQEGLVRFATEKYSLASLGNLFAHLTNTSINKLGPCYGFEKEQVGWGCKWTMSKFRSFLQSQGINELLLWQRINNIVTLTLLTIASSVPYVANCIELFGFDVLIDANLKPWLLEVNCSPSLAMDCAADVTVKKSLLHDLIDLMSYREVDRLRCRGYPRPQCGLSSLRGHWPSQGARLSMSSLRMSGSEGPPICCGCTAPGPCKRVHVSRGSRLNFSLQLPSIEGTELMGLPEASFENRNLSSHRSLKPPVRHVSLCFRKLPTIRPQKCRCAAASADGRLKDNWEPPCRVGDFILTFPFNEVTLKASQNKLEIKIAIQEVHKVLHWLMPPCVHNMKKQRADGTNGGAEKDSFQTLFWGPRNPPLRSECCFPR